MNFVRSGPCGSYCTTNIYSKNGIKIVEKNALPDDIKTNEPTYDFVRELGILSYLPNHPNVVEFLSTEPHKIYTYYGGKNLHEQMPNTKIDELIKQLIKGVAFLHLSRVAHRDLSTNNIVVSNGKLRIIDFGMARYIPKYSMSTNEDTYTWNVVCLWNRPPELYNVEDNFKYDPFKVDAWSVGTLIVQLLGGVPWLNCRNSEEQYETCKNIDTKKIVKYLKKYYRNRWVDFAENLIHGFLKIDVDERLSCIEAANMLQIIQPINIDLINYNPIVMSTYESLRERCIHIMGDICHDFQTHIHTFSFACGLFDRYINDQTACSDIDTITRLNFNNIAIACVIISSRFMDIKPIFISTVIQYFENYDEESIIKLEYDILDALRGRIIIDVIDNYIPKIYANIPKVKELKVCANILLLKYKMSDLVTAIDIIYRNKEQNEIAIHLQKMYDDRIS
tara:strand:- start:4003 stop:5352 length:1350 start_codon:yes stop_codon:yes gene_type:complete